ncbi:MAG: S8 family serine peptidase [Bacteroidota bacterium]
MRFPFFCLIICLFTAHFPLQAQRIDHVQGDVIVQVGDLPENFTVEEWAENLRDSRGQLLGLEYAELISDYVGIHLLKFDFTKVDERIILQILYRQPEVIYAQFNHFTSLRETIPDDPEFLNQWQYINTGQSGGSPGADIDIELAWDYTTGGLTSRGDTIVACIVDDGIDETHPDIAPNLWLNHAEIPDNGIDDDGNGYVDDYRGWSTFSGNDDVYGSGWHGTPVTGIVGAKGNDGFGVAGVNWDVKLMIVQGGSGVESEVLQAYSYPLEMRKTYNETDGEEGAFVVVTNSSWGVDFGQPEDSPLWCNFYDSLGVQGILNCGATINGEEDVDEVGDLPTACLSDYLISVTNMNHFDQKVNGAGYGLKAIDLGAFGAGTWTTSIGGGFDGFGGTSGATPHVAGTVALMYALECPDLMSLVASDPGAAALLIKDAILNGVDPNESLAGITVTGGRLNVNNSMLRLLEQCGACLPPFSPDVLADNDTTAILNWTAADTVDALNFRWRIAGSNDWIVVEDASPPIALENLTGCTTYEYQMQVNCDTISSEYGSLRTFTTEGCCNNPEEISILISDQGPMAALFWSDVFGVEAYEVDLRDISADTDWETYSTGQTNIIFDNLAECNEYAYRFRLICPADTNLYTSPVNFFMPGCGACTDVDYCEISDLDVAEEYISQVQIGEEFLQVSEGGDEGYADFTYTAPDLTLEVGTEYPIVLTPAFTDQEFPEGWAVFIDYNQDGFFDQEERAYASPGLSPNPVEGTITIPEIALRGLTRMRVIMTWNNTATIGCGILDSQYGEVEDYCVTIADRGNIYIDYTDLNPGILIGGGANSDIPLQGPVSGGAYLRSRFGGEDEWAVYPNPSSGLMTLKYSPETLSNHFSIQVSDLHGKVLYTEELSISNSSAILDLNHLQTGVYLVQFRDKGKSLKTLRWVKQ